MIERRLTMTVQEAAEVIGISRTSAYLCAARGELPTRRFGRRVLVLVAPFLAMLDDDSGRLNAAGDRHNDQDPWDLRQLEGTSSCSALLEPKLDRSQRQMQHSMSERRTAAGDAKSPER